MTTRRRIGRGAVLLLLALPAACAALDDARPPAWRQPGPAALDPPERQRDPDDGYLDYLAEAAPTRA